MRFIKDAWSWINGKKTAFGAVLLFLANAPHLSGFIGQEAIDIIYYIGTGLAGIGIGHKFVKGKQNE